ncbi:MAG: hypothetical protein QGG71_25170, partial [Pirellulaceae bacterium]|nr:hypothetical protein [Pirellulaceae bacterium]
MKPYQRAMAAMIIGQFVSLACGLWISERFSQFTIDRDATEAPASSRETTSTQTNSNLLIVRVLPLIWIGGLQAGVVYMVMTQLRNEMSKGHNESNMRILHREKDLVRTRTAIIFGLAKLA